MYKLPAYLAMVTAVCMPLAAPAATAVYAGDQQVGSIHASYTVTTDGLLGVQDASHIVSFSVTLSDSISSITYQNGTFYIPGYFGSNATVTGEYFATTTTLYLQQPNFSGSLQLDYSYIYLTTPPRGFGGAALDFYEGVLDAGIADSFGPRFGFKPIPAVFATAVPEPASWAMMNTGFGMIGAAMRRRNLRFAAA